MLLIKGETLNRVQIGKEYEEMAAAHLISRGMNLVMRNFRCKRGEIDLIGIHKGCLVFVEVKYRRDNSRGAAEEAVGVSKQKKICHTSDYFRISYKQYQRMQVRYDVVTVTENQINWYQNAFPYQGSGGW